MDVAAQENVETNEYRKPNVNECFVNALAHVHHYQPFGLHFEEFGSVEEIEGTIIQIERQQMSFVQDSLGNNGYITYPDVSAISSSAVFGVRAPVPAAPLPCTK
jgi:hypothetical protein